MALLPKAVDMAPPASRGAQAEAEPPAPLAITTPEALPEAIAGRPYAVALAATGGRGPLRWTLDGPMPEGPDLRARSAGILEGTPRAKGTPAAASRWPSASATATEIATPVRPAPGLPERSAAGDPRLVEARPPPGPLEGLARPGGGLPGPLAGPPGRHGHAGQPGTEHSPRDRSRSRATRPGRPGRAGGSPPIAS